MTKTNNWRGKVKTHKARNNAMIMQCFSSSSLPTLRDVFTVAQIGCFILCVIDEEVLKLWRFQRKNACI